MGTGIRAGVIAAVLAGVAQTAGAQHEQTFRAELQGAAVAGQRNVFVSDAQSLQNMQDALNDPQQRPALLAEHRTSIEAGHPDLAQALGIDAATEQKFFDLLAEQQIERLIDFHNRPRQMPAGPQMFQGMADSQTKLIEAQRALLGDQAMERYRDYMDTLGPRLQVAYLDARLGNRDKLQPEQKARLISLMHEHDPLRAAQPSRPPPMHRVELEAGSLGAQGPRVFGLVDHAQRMEEMLKNTLAADRQLLASATGLLTMPQLKALEAMRTENADRLQQSVKRMRANTAASSEISAVREAQPADQYVRKALPGDIKIEATVTVDGGKPALIKHTGPNGQAIEVEVDGLVVEVTPTLYEGDWLDTQLTYFEQGSNGRRRIGSGSQGGMVSQSPAGSLYGGGGATVIVGSKKAYAVQTDVAAAAL